jgi:transposase
MAGSCPPNRGGFAAVQSVAPEVDTSPPPARRSPLSQSTTRCIGLAVHNDAMAVASIAQAPGAAGGARGSRGTRQGDIAPLVRQRPATATQLLCVSAAGPCGSWLSRELLTTGDACGGVAPALLPPQPGARVTTDRRDAGPLARLARAGDLIAVSVPTGAAAAMRALPRARAAARSACNDAQVRRTAFLRRPARRSTGRAPWSPAPCRWLAAGVGPPPAPHSGLPADVRAVRAPPERLQRREQALQAQGPAGRVPPVVEALPARRGVPGPVAAPRGAAIGDRSRCAPPRALRQCLGRPPAA